MMRGTEKVHQTFTIDRKEVDTSNSKIIVELAEAGDDISGRAVVLLIPLFPTVNSPQLGKLHQL